MYGRSFRLTEAVSMHVPQPCCAHQAALPAAKIKSTEFAERYCKGDRFSPYNGAQNTEELNRLITAAVMIRRRKQEVLPQVRIWLRRRRSQPWAARSVPQKCSAQPSQSSLHTMQLAVACMLLDNAAASFVGRDNAQPPSSLPVLSWCSQLPAKRRARVYLHLDDAAASKIKAQSDELTAVRSIISDRYNSAGGGQLVGLSSEQLQLTTKLYVETATSKVDCVSCLSAVRPARMLTYAYSRFLQRLLASNTAACSSDCTRHASQCMRVRTASGVGRSRQCRSMCATSWSRRALSSLSLRTTSAFWMAFSSSVRRARLPSSGLMATRTRASAKGCGSGSRRTKPVG
eukprot:358752-Chlamydomonas_euryale.AAC.11